MIRFTFSLKGRNLPYDHSESYLPSLFLIILLNEMLYLSIYVISAANLNNIGTLVYRSVIFNLEDAISVS